MGLARAKDDCMGLARAKDDCMGLARAKDDCMGLARATKDSMQGWLVWPGDLLTSAICLVFQFATSAVLST